MTHPIPTSSRSPHRRRSAFPFFAASLATVATLAALTSSTRLSAQVTPDERTAPATEAKPKGITPIQTMRLRQVVGLFPGPDGALAFTRTEPRMAGGPAGPALLHLFQLVDGKEVPIWTGPTSVGSVAWQPGANRLTVVHKRADAEHAEVCAFDQPNVEPTRLTTTPSGVKNYVWSPDGSALAFVAADAPSDERRKARAAGFRQVVVDEDWTHDSLWLWQREGGEIRRLTEGKTVHAYRFSPDGKQIVAGLAPRNLVDDSYMFTQLHLVDVATSTVQMLVPNPGKLGDFAWSPDGRRVAYVAGADRNDPHAGMLYVVDTTSKVVKPLTDGLRGCVHHVAFGSDGAIRASVSIGVRSTRMRFDPETGASSIEAEAEGHEFRDFALAAGPIGTVYKTADSGPTSPRRPPLRTHSLGDVYKVSTSRHPFEVYRHDGNAFVRLTNSNPWLDDVPLAKQEVVTITARDGLQIEGVLIHPLTRTDGVRAPLIIVVHGGPEAHFGNGWLTNYGNWGQTLAARGFAVWFPNYRASTGYGVEFAKANFGDVMGGEFHDHLDAIDHFAKSGLIDPERVGIGGGSYGGYAAAWAATRHSDRFAAAVSFVPFVDIRTKWLTSDIPNEFFLVHYQEKWPHEQSGYLADRSPLTYAAQCRTPLLLLGGTSDPRVHPSQPFMLYRAVLHATKTPVRYVQYPGEGHGNRGNTAQADFLLRTIQWFEHYLQPGNRRTEPLPPLDPDYSDWYATQSPR